MPRQRNKNFGHGERVQTNEFILLPSGNFIFVNSLEFSCEFVQFLKSSNEQIHPPSIWKLHFCVFCRIFL
ncbi:hypothetical protein PanWU01x14_025880 [Parasponia andersonii]|uniref:Uncharacterized protein n=1 Tax=Parasponia andersonii TaxID=3476 RepID=A0A2P5DVW7_PARAD|nr:hypothetical protein PanWU01x14_025880 [Parasponia andersonii]